MATAGTAVTSSAPARLDALPWSRWHWRVVIALGVTWLLDGLEVTLVGSLGAVLQRPETLGLSAAAVGWAGAAYVAGAVIGALWFGRLADRIGRKRLFLITLTVYVSATVLTGLTWDLPSFLVCRFVTGLGIGGEYAAINSAIDELIPARVRGTVNLAINGSFWIGAALGAGLSVALLHPAWIGPELGWRIAFLLGAVLGVAILLVRRNLPESPRWLLAHGRTEEAEAIVAAIEQEVAREHGPRPHPGLELRLRVRPVVTWGEILRVLIFRYRSRAVLGFTLMAAQAFFYNAIFFTYALVLARYYGVPDDRVGLYIFPFALGNFLGPLVLGPFFDSKGRRAMIALTYAASGIGLAASGYAFAQGWLDATAQAMCWAAIFFIASAAASSAYLTVSETFPVEMRAVAIAIFYAAGTGAGGVIGPALFGMLIETGSRGALFYGYLIAAALMCVAAVVAIVLGVAAERRPLEHVAPPLSAEAGKADEKA
ncbi:MAG TPA: MFS transporter [Burkholderiales bacterium]|jgi:MFS family permease